MVRNILLSAYTLLWVFIITIVGFCIVWGIAFYGLCLFIFYIFYRLVMKCIEIWYKIVRKPGKNQNDGQ